MVTRHCTRRYISRPPYPYCTKRLTLRNNSFYYFWSLLFLWILLSLLPLQSSPHSRARRLLTPNRHYPTKPLRSTTPKHICFTGLRSINHLSPPQPDRRQPQTHASSTIHHNYPRPLLHIITSLRILWNPFHNLRWSLWLHLLHGNRFPRTPCYYWLHIPSRMLYTTVKIPLYIYTPLWIRSRGMILTLCRCRLTIPVCVYLLMRLLFF